MARSDIYEPKQKRSIEKKNRIMEIGIELMIEKGYHHTTTDDIAAAAGVSTGIIYRYFKDKHDILIAGLKFYFRKMEQEHSFSIRQNGTEDTEGIAQNLLARFLKIHKDYWNLHEELEAMRHSDTEVAALYDQAETAIILQITNELRTGSREQNDLPERVFCVFHLVEGYCHMHLRPIPPEINLEQMKRVTIATINRLLYE